MYEILMSLSLKAIYKFPCFPLGFDVLFHIHLAYVCKM